MRKCFCLAALLALTSPSTFPAAEDSLFVPAPNSPVAWEGTPGSMEVGDVNGDGALDLIVTNLELGHAGVFLGDNSGKFRSIPESFPNTSGVISVLDANEDGHLDVVAVDDTGYGVELFLGDGKGGFTRSPGSPFKTKDGNNPRPRGFAAADVNEDGHADALISNYFDGDVSGAFGDGKGHFTPMPRPITVGQNPFNLVLADVNGDQHVDICTPTSEGNIGLVTILHGDGRGGFTPGTPFEGAPDPYAVAFGDVNGDGRDDIATIQAEGPLVTVGLGDGKGRFTLAPGSPFTMAGAPYATDIAMSDANRDGRMDLFLTTGRNIQVYLANEKGEVTPAPGSPYTAGKGTWHFVLGDWNKDEKCDIAAPGFEDGTITVLLGR